MAFTLNNWVRVSASANEPITQLADSSFTGGPRVYSYFTGDTQTAAAASGYFNSVASELVTGDLIAVYSSNTGTAVWYNAVNTAGVITTVAFP